VKGFATINTDASYHREFELGAFAFWIKSDYGKITQCGPLRNRITNKNGKGPTEAEVQCIINAFYLLKKANYPAFHTIIVNTDSLNSIAILTNDKVEIKKWGLQWGNTFRDAFNSLKPKNCNIEFRHIRAHKHTNTPKNFINDWCDKQAKKMLWDIINKKQL
jgi:ribonuclease HI